MIGDDDFLKPSVFLSRVGGRAGNDVERSMSATVLDLSSFNTRILDLPGQKVMLRTRGGAPEFTVIKDEPVGCVKGPFIEQDPATVAYVPRSYHPDTVVSTWKNLVSVTIRRLKYVVLRNTKKQLIRFSFRAKDEPAPSGMPKADLEFDESSAERTYFADDGKFVLPYQFPNNNNVYARFKAVLRPIKTVSCLLNKSVTFADPESAGIPPASPGCVRDVLGEPYASTRAFTDGWLREQDLVSGNGLVHLSFLADKGFLSPLETGEDVACAEIPAIGTRIIGLRNGTHVKRLDGSIRLAASHERADSPFIFWLKPKNSPADPDEYGNVGGLLWRPGTNKDEYGPDVVVGTSSTPFPTSILRVNSDDSVWQITIGYITTSEIGLLYRLSTTGSVSGTITAALTWGAAQTSALSSYPSTLRVITDISSTGDRFVVSWLVPALDNIWSTTVMALEIVIDGDFPAATATATWIFTDYVSIGGPNKFVSEPGGVVEGCYYDTDDSLRLVLSLSKTDSSWNVNISATNLSKITTDTTYYAACSVPVGATALPTSISWLPCYSSTRTDIGLHDPDSPEGMGIYLVNRTTTTTDIGGGVMTTSTTSVRYEAAVGAFSGASVSYSGDRRLSYGGPKLMQMPTYSTAFAAIRRGDRVVPSVSYDATIRSDGSMANSDEITNFLLYNPVEDSVSVVARVTNGFPQDWITKLNFV